MFFRKKKTIVFVDGSNLYRGLLENFGSANIDFGAFISFLVAKNKLVKTYYCNVPVNRNDKPEEYKRQQKFFSALRRIPRFEVKLGRLEKRPGAPPVEKGVDVWMAVDIVTHAYSNIFDVAVLVSGDSDFVPAIEAVQDFGKKVINVCFPKTKSFHLNQVCDETITVNKAVFGKLAWKKR